MKTDMEKDAADVRPSASVVVARPEAEGFSVLMLRRNPRLRSFGGMWAFPGGQIDDEDYREAENGGEAAAAVIAAERETLEETGLRLDRRAFIFIGRWTTPAGYPRRFRTWFYLTPVPWSRSGDPTSQSQRVRVDGGEIIDHKWLTARAVLSARESGQMGLPPPIFVILTRLSAFSDAGEMLTAMREAPPLILTPRMATVPGGRCFLYPEDAGYTLADPDAPGPRHRLWALEGGWRYEREFQS